MQELDECQWVKGDYFDFARSLGTGAR